MSVKYLCGKLFLSFIVVLQKLYIEIFHFDYF
ncbi:hypothetical protein T03_3018 [Trichinella britovi]|uniref:Uncharacterized protein n=1 Tax=Trichinella britovi TaxID=45882 RepID=A0A0V0YSR6_TRIBR|nr:hypothetical protein T03_3018 [Trichinella britovi]